MELFYNGRSAAFDPATLAFGTTSTDLVSDNSQHDDPQVPPQFLSDPSKRELVLDRLVLNVANFCNLNCVYCYAQGGSYGGPTEKLAHSIGRTAITKFLERYDQVKLIQYFGGEPFLNFRLICALCDFCKEEACRLGRPVPSFGVVTNGTILNEEIIELLVRHRIEVTVSLDGPPEVTDPLRFLGSDRHNTRTVIRNIQQLKSVCGEPTQIEGTYTKLHVDKRISVNDILDFVRSELNVGLLHLSNNVLSTALVGNSDCQAIDAAIIEDVSQSFSEGLTRSYRHLVARPVHEITILEMALDFLDILATAGRRELRHICPAGSGTIAVDTDGAVYPCFMLYRIPEFRIGNVEHAGEFLCERGRVAFAQENLIDETIVRHSWAKQFFHGCAGGNFHKAQRHDAVANWEVEFFERTGSAAIVELAALKEAKEFEFLKSAVRLFRAYHSLR